MLGKTLTNEEKLEEIYRMTLDNHEVLKSIQRQQTLSSVFRALYWIIIIGATVGSYYYFKPYFDMLLSNRSKIEETFNQLQQLKSQMPETGALNQLIEGLHKSAVSEQ